MDCQVLQQHNHVERSGMNLEWVESCRHFGCTRVGVWKNAINWALCQFRSNVKSWKWGIRWLSSVGSLRYCCWWIWRVLWSWNLAQRQWRWFRMGGSWGGRVNANDHICTTCIMKEYTVLSLLSSNLYFYFFWCFGISKSFFTWYY